MLSLTRTFFYVSLLAIQVSLFGPITPTATIPGMESDGVPSRAASPFGTPTLDAATATFTQLQQALKVQTENAAALNEQLRLLEANQTKIGTLNTDLSAQNIQLSKEKAELAAQIATLQESLKSAQATLAAKPDDTVVAELAQTKTALAETKSNLEKTTTALDEKTKAEDARKAEMEELRRENEAFKTQQTRQQEALSDQDAKALQIGQQQWLRVEQQLIAALAEPIAGMARTTNGLRQVISDISKKLSGQRVSLQQLAAARTQNEALQKQITALSGASAAVAEATKEKDDISAQLKEALSQSNQHKALIAELEANLANAHDEIKISKKTLKKMKTSAKAPAQQLQVKLALLQQLFENGLAQLTTQVGATGRSVNALQAHVQNSLDITARLTAFDRALKKLFADLTGYFGHVTESLKTTGGSPSRETEENERTIAALKDEVTSLTQQYSSLSTSANAQIAALQAHVDAARNSSPSSNPDIQRLQAQIDAQRERELQQQLIDAKLDRAQLASRVDLLSSTQQQGQLTQGALGSLRDSIQQNTFADITTRQTDAAMSAAQAASSDAKLAVAQSAAQQAIVSATGAAVSANTANSTTLSTAIASAARGIGQQPLGQVMASYPGQSQTMFGSTPQYGQMVPGSQMMGQMLPGVPVQGQQLVQQFGLLAQAPRPATSQDLQTKMQLVVQNYGRYKQQYLQAVQLIQGTSISMEVRNRIDDELQKAIKLEAWYLYQYGLYGGQSARMDAVQKIQELITDIEIPLKNYETNTLAPLKFSTPPDDVIQLLNGYLSNLGSAPSGMMGQQLALPMY